MPLLRRRSSRRCFHSNTGPTSLVIHLRQPAKFAFDLQPQIVNPLADLGVRILELVLHGPQRRRIRSLELLGFTSKRARTRASG